MSSANIPEYSGIGWIELNSVPDNLSNLKLIPLLRYLGITP